MTAHTNDMQSNAFKAVASCRRLADEKNPNFLNGPLKFFSGFGKVVKLMTRGLHNFRPFDGFSRCVFTA